MAAKKPTTEAVEGVTRLKAWPKTVKPEDQKGETYTEEEALAAARAAPGPAGPDEPEVDGGSGEAEPEDE